MELILGTIICWLLGLGCMWILEKISYATGIDFFYISTYTWLHKWWSWLIAAVFTFLTWLV